MYTVFLRPSRTVNCVFGTKNPGQNTGQKPGQKSTQKPGPNSGQKSGQNLAKIWACRPCIKNPGVVHVYEIYMHYAKHTHFSMYVAYTLYRI